MLSLQLLAPVAPPLHVANISFPNCRCGSNFRCVLRGGFHYVELQRSHRCLYCRRRASEHALANHYLIEEE